MMHNKQIKNRFVLFLQKFMLAALKALILSKSRNMLVYLERIILPFLVTWRDFWRWNWAWRQYEKAPSCLTL